MKNLFRALLFLSLFLLPGYAELEINSKAQKYLQLLVKKPRSGYIFDKFYLAWLDSASSKDLKDFLIEKSKTSINHKILLSFYYKKTGHDLEALKVLKDLIEKKKDSAVLLYEKSRLESNTLNFENAISDLKLACKLEMGPELKMKVFKQLGKVQLRNQDVKGALETWNAMAKEFKDDEIEEDILELKIAEGLYDEAEKDCLAMIETAKQPRIKVTLLLRLGDIYQRSGKKEQALKSYSKTLSMVGKGSWLEKEIIAQISHVYNLDGDKEGLIEKIVELSEEHPDKINLLKELSTLYLASDEAEKALEVVKKILKIEPSVREYKLSYISILKKTSKEDEALSALEKLSKEYPKDGELIIDLALLHHKMENQKLCEQKIDDYLKLNQKNQYQFLRAGQLLTNFKYTEKATSVYREMVLSFPESLEAKENLAAHLYANDKKEEALKIYTNNANSGGAEMLFRTVRILKNLKELELSYSLLLSNKEANFKDFQYKQLLCECQLSLKKHSEAKETALNIIEKTDAITVYKKGLTYIRQACSKKEELEEVLKLIKDSEKINYQCLSADILLIQGDIESANKRITGLITKNPKHLLLNLLNLKLKIELREWKNAIEIAKNLMVIDKNQKIKYIKKIIDFETQSNEMENALKWIAEWKKFAPGQIDPYLKEATIFTDQGRSKEGLESYKKAALKFPDNEEVLSLLAKAYADEGQLDDARRIYWKLISVSKDLASKMSVTYNMIHVLMVHGSLDSLKKTFEEKMKQDKKAIYPIMALSAIFQSEGDYEGRRRYLIKATELKSNDVSLLHEIANIEMNEGEYDKAIATLEKADALDKSTKSKIKLAEIHLNKGDEEKNLEYLLKVLAQGKSDIKSFENITESLIISQQLEQALTVVENGLKEFPDHYRLKFLKGVVYEESQNYEEAIRVFSELQTVKKVKEKKLPKALTLGYGYRNAYYKMMPKDVTDIVMSMNNDHRLYQYRQPQRRHASYSRFNVTTGRILLPNDLDTTHSYSFGHLKKIYPQIEEEKQKEMIRKLEINDVKFSELKFKMNYQITQSVDFWDEMKKRYKGESIIDLLKFQYMARRTGLNDEFVKAYHEIKIEYPEYAGMLYLSAINRGEVDEKVLETIFKLCQKNNDIAVMYVSQVAQIMSRQSSLNDKIQVLLRKQISELYPQLKQKNPWVVSMLINSLARDEDSTNLMKFLEGILNEKTKNQSMQMQYGFYGGYGRQNQSIVVSNNFPPMSLGKFPATVLSLFLGRNMYGRGVSLNPESLIKNIDKVKNPILKILILNHCEKNEQVKTMMETLIDEKMPTYEQYLLKSAWLSTNEQLSESIQLLNKARYLTLPLKDRKSIDGKILGLAIDSENKKDIESGVKAALRLKLSRLSMPEKASLVGAMESLGMEKEAEKLDKKISISSNSPSFSRGFSHRSSSTNKKQLEKIQALINDQEYDKAVKLLYREYSTFCRAYFTAMTSNNVYESSLHSFWNYLKNKSIKEKMKAMLIKSSESKATIKMVELAYFYEKTASAEEALELYKAVLEKNKKLSIAGIRLAMLMLNNDDKEANEVLANVAKNGNFDQLMNMLVQVSNNGDRSLEKKITSLKLFEGLVKNNESKKNLQYHWFTSVVSIFTNSYYEDGASIPRLDRVDYQKSYSKLKGKYKKFADKRIELFKSFLLVCLDTPEISLKAFKYLLAYNKFFKINSEGLMTYCEKAIENHASKSMMAQHVSHYFNSSRSTGIKFEDPLSYFFKNIQKDKVGVFMKKIELLKNKNFIKKLKAKQELLNTNGEEFIAKAKKYIQNDSSTIYNQNLTALNDVVSIWISKNDDTIKFEEFLLAEISKNTNNYNLGLTIEQYGDHLMKNEKGETKVVDFVKKLKSVLMKGTVIKKSMTPVNSPYVSQKLQIFTRSITTLLNKDKLRFRILNIYDPVFLKSPWLEQSGMNSVRLSNPTLDSYLYSPYIKEISDYKNYSLSSYNGTLLYTLLYKMSYKSDLKKEVLKKLKSIKKQTFGTEFIIYAGQNFNKNSIYEYLHDKLPLIKKESEEVQTVFAETIHAIFLKDRNNRSNISTEKAKLFKAYIDKKTSVSKSAMVDAFLKRSVEYNNPYSYSEKAKSLLRELISSDTDMFKKVYERANKKLKNIPSNSSRNGVKQTHEELLRRAAYESAKGMKQYMFLQNYFKASHSYAYKFNSNVEKILSNEFVTIFNIKMKGLKKVKNETENYSVSFLYTVEEISKVLGKSILPIYIYNIKRLVSDKKQQKIILEKLNSKSEQTPFLKELKVNLDYSWNLYNKKTIPVEMLNVLKEHFDNPKISNSNKICYFNQYYNYLNSKSNSSELVKLCSSAFIETKEYMFTDYTLKKHLPLFLEELSHREMNENLIKQVDTLYSHWLKHTVASLRNSSYNSRQTISQDVKNYGFCLLKLLLKNPNKDKIKKVFRHRTMALYREPIAYMMLLLNDREELFLSEFKNNFLKLEFAMINLNTKVKCSLNKEHHSYGIHVDFKSPNEETKAKVFTSIGKLEKEEHKYVCELIYASMFEKDFNEKVSEYHKLELSSNKIKNIILKLLLKPGNEKLMKKEWIEYCSGEDITEVYYNSKNDRRNRYNSYLKILFEGNDMDAISKILTNMSTALASSGSRNDNKYKVGYAHKAICDNFASFSESFPTKKEFQNQKTIDFMYDLGNKLLEFEGLKSTTNGKYNLIKNWFVFYLLELPKREKSEGDVKHYKELLGNNSLYISSLNTKLDRYTFLNLDNESVVKIYANLIDKDFVKSWGVRRLRNVHDWKFFKKYPKALEGAKAAMDKKKVDDFIKLDYSASSYGSNGVSVLKELLYSDEKRFIQVLEVFVEKLKGKYSTSTSHGLKRTEIDYRLSTLLGEAKTIDKKMLISNFLISKNIELDTMHYSTRTALSDFFYKAYNDKQRELQKIDKKEKDKNTKDAFMHAVKTTAALVKNSVLPYDAYKVVRYLNDKVKKEVITLIENDKTLYDALNPSPFIQETLLEIKYRMSATYNKRTIPKEYVDFINKRTRNKKIPLLIREYFIKYYVSKFDRTKNNVEIIDGVLETLLENAPNKISLSDMNYYLTTSLENFSNKKVNDEWKSKTEKLISIWNLLTKHFSDKYKPSRTSSDHQYFMQNSMMMLELLLKYGDSVKTKLFFKNEYLQLFRDPVAYMLLLSKGSNKLFLEEFEKNCENFEFKNFSNSNSYKCKISNKMHRFGLHIDMDPISEARETSALETIGQLKDETKRNIAKYIFTVFTNKKVDAIEKECLASWKKNKNLNEVFSSLLLRSVRIKTTKKEWIEHCSKEKIIDVVSNNITFKRNRYSTYLRFLFEENNVSELRVILKDISQAADKNASRANTALGLVSGVYRSFYSMLYRTSKYKSPEYRKFMFELGKEIMMLDGLQRYSYTKSQVLPYWFVLYLLNSPDINKAKEEVAVLKENIGRKISVGSIQSYLDRFKFLELDEQEVKKLYKCIEDSSFQKAWGMGKVTNLKNWAFFKKYKKIFEEKKDEKTEKK